MKQLLSDLIEQLSSQATLLEQLDARVSVLEKTIKRSDLLGDFEAQQGEEKKVAGKEAPNTLSKLRELLSQIPD